ncbi:retrovirus-related Pol polyprotein from transposon 412 [Trichonephila clavipes]|nr:retrovirus-related Pol polyprotein from transposon 412 [Trichonephila clavipes]
MTIGHEAAAVHLGVTKTKDAIFKTFYWPICFSDVEDFVKTCDTNIKGWIFSRIGFPRELQTDQGTSFMSALTTEFLERFGVKVVRSSVYHPQSNPVERMHRTLKRILETTH